MPYQFTQTGAEIQDILNQVPVNTSELTKINSGYVNSTPGTDPSVASGSWVLVHSVAGFAPGIYLVYYGVSFASNATGRRMIGLNTDTSSYSANRYGITANAVDGYQTRMGGVYLLQLTATSPFAVWAYQNSGSALTAQPFIRAIRLH